MFHFNSPEFWVAIAFLIFVGVLIKMGVPSMITTALDDRADAVRKELDQARRLREEAQDLLADYQRKQRAADEEARAIIEQARREAETMKAESAKSLREQLERRTRLASIPTRSHPPPSVDARNRMARARSSPSIAPHRSASGFGPSGFGPGSRARGGALGSKARRHPPRGGWLARV